MSANCPGSFARHAAPLPFHDSGRRDLLQPNRHRAARSELSDGVAGSAPAPVAGPVGLLEERAATVWGTLPASMSVPAESANCRPCFDAGFPRGPRKRCWDASDLASSLGWDGPADAYLCLARLRQVVERVFQVSEDRRDAGEFPRFPACCIGCCRDGPPVALLRVALVSVVRVRVVRVGANKAALGADIHRVQTIHPNESATKIRDDKRTHTPATSQPMCIPNWT